MSRVVDSQFSEVHLGEREDPEPVELDPDRPFKILLVGDFSGRAWRDNPARSLTPRPIDRDNFDDVLASLNPGVDLHGIKLSFREFEDFHPDRIYEAAEIFQNLDQHLEPPPPPPQAARAPSSRPAASGSLLDQMIDEHDPEPDAPISLDDAADLPSFIQRITKGHVVARPDAASQAREARRETLATDLMRGILHHPRLQAIEAAWRALFLLVRGLDTDGELKLYILDLTLPELIAELAPVQKELRRRGPFALIAGNYSFGQSDLDAQVLGRLALLAKSLGAPFVAEAKLPGESTAGSAWPKLRHSPDARWIGLALPRFLLRLPYGKDTLSVETFPFEEMPESEHQAYLWGNPAFLCAHLLGETFLARGWEMNPTKRRMDGLPLHVYQDDGEPTAKPCAEILMTEKDANKLMEAGYMPLATIKREPAAMIVRFQSIADPIAALGGLK